MVSSRKVDTAWAEAMHHVQFAITLLNNMIELSIMQITVALGRREIVNIFMLCKVLLQLVYQVLVFDVANVASHFHSIRTCKAHQSNGDQGGCQEPEPKSEHG
mmetsp:Transcript_63576/g.138274  ORF Transcript_63576/g.138274 Transcript_63576/m.138274 type:complete len:103 (-) Transcript_63576:2-310(-)